LGICTALLAPVLFTSSASAQVWEETCREGETCTVPATRPIRYGLEGLFNYGVASGTFQCNSRTFGDPAPNRRKSCYAYFTADELAGRQRERNKDQRIRTLEQEVQTLRADLSEANLELEDLYRELRRNRPRGRGPGRGPGRDPFR
jgi:hypothetical protein